MATDAVVPPEQFASAASTCIKALKAGVPANLLAAVEADDWKLRQTTPLGGFFKQAGSAVELKIENVLGSRVCTVLGNRDPKLPIVEMSQLIENRLKEIFPEKLRRDETGADYTIIVEEKYLAVITTALSANRFNTQITTIEKYVRK